jgi:glycosyltransferase involved in cell wall biosynthesis
VEESNKPKMKILCVIDSLGSGGAQRQLINLSVGFKERGHNVSFLVYHNINFYKEVLDENNIPIYEIIEPNYLKRLLKMRRFIRQGSYDAVLSFLDAANFICEMSGLPWRKWKLVVGERSANPAILKSIKARLFRWAHLLADYVVANSNANIKIVKKINPLLPSHKCHVIYNVVDLKKWEPDTDYIPLYNGKLRIVIAASHQYLKNLNGLVEAVHLLNSKEKEKLKIDWYGGQRSDNSKILALERIKYYQLENIFTFFEPTPSILQIMSKADAIGLFSYYEGLPNAICEAMSIGKVVIATFVSDIPQLILNKKLLSDPNDPKSISKSLKYLLQQEVNDLKIYGKENRKMALTRFDSKIIIDKYLYLLTN